MNTRKTLLLAVSLFAIMIVIYLLYFTVPDIKEYASNAHLFEEPREGYVWAEWVLEAREMFWKTLIWLILQICFFTSVAFWSTYEAIKTKDEARKEPKPKLQQKLIVEKTKKDEKTKRVAFYGFVIFSFLTLVYLSVMLGCYFFTYESLLFIILMIIFCDSLIVKIQQRRQKRIDRRPILYGIVAIIFAFLTLALITEMPNLIVEYSYGKLFPIILTIVVCGSLIYVFTSFAQKETRTLKPTHRQKNWERLYEKQKKRELEDRF